MYYTHPLQYRPNSGCNLSARPSMVKSEEQQMNELLPEEYKQNQKKIIKKSQNTTNKILHE